ncbi:rhodanese-like domain-containing protein [Aquimarina agarivorans]|uniref:rhodanese-like domain-containing protein n=1 Tax=Aquimarina agarivorans TaxID=980584 RepID=UPI000248F896|nr:rhodanese-like domain-containing protein [Aquimarina agarivorans]
MNKLLYAIFIGFSTITFAQKTTLNTDFSAMLGDLLTHSVTEVLPSEIYDENEVVFLDAREKEEYIVSHIKGSKWVGYDTFTPKNVKDIEKDKPIVVYCTVGYRSEKITEKLLKMGYSNVSNLYGGIFEWVHQDRKVYNDSSQTKKIHTYNKDWSQWLEKGEKVY